MVIGCINWSRLHLYFAPVSLELFDNQHRQGRVNALAHFGLTHNDGDAVVRADPHESIWSKYGRSWRDSICAAGISQFGKIQTYQKTAADCRASSEEVAPLHYRGHSAPPSPLIAAARWIAWRIRGYVPQRQIFPVMASSMSLSVGFAFSASKTAALMIWPDWQ